MKLAELCFCCADGTTLPVTVRSSTRARNQRITLNHQGTLEVVFPNGTSARSVRKHRSSRKAEGGETVPAQGEVEAFLETHRSWIERAAKRTQPQREAYELSKAAGLPTHLEFPSIGELWLLEYQATAASKVTLTRAGMRSVSDSQNHFGLRLSGAVHDEATCVRALKRFVSQRAKEALPAFGWRICDTVGARPKDIAVNNRKSAWGLCSHDGSIKLDRKLLFLPEDLAGQIVLHEVAHLRQMNHSQRFYDELFSLDGSSKEAERAVKGAMIYIPAWLR